MNTRLIDTLSHVGTLRCPGEPVLPLRNQRLILKLWLVFIDVLMLALAFKIALWIRFDLQLTVAPEVVPPPDYYRNLVMLLLPVWLLVFSLFSLYSPKVQLGGSAEYARVFHACTSGAMILVIMAFFIPQLDVSRVWLVSSWLVSFFLVALIRFTNRRLVYSLRSRGYFLAPSVVVGTNREAAALAADLGDWRSSGLRILGFVSSRNADAAAGASGPPLGNVRDIRRIIASYGVEDLIVAITALDRDELLRLGEDVNGMPGVNLRLSSGLYELFTTGVTVRTLGTVPLLSVNKMRLEPEEVLIKGLLDYTSTLAISVVLSPVMLVLALLVKLDSPGPVFHRRRVLGMHGREFDAFKFRTMHQNGDRLLRENEELNSKLQANHKLKDDPRVTGTGRWLRKYSLDELPQLYNVLLGQMSLVGPRMITQAEAERYGLQKLNLLTVKPGITGLWQVSGRSDLSYEDRVRLDLYYIRNYSVWLDLQILFVQTLPAVLRGRGAY